ncbi:MAG: DNA-processing protein DprA [Saprospiraceae bacterium]|nr:DNA-processing protein DprA [Saprospiraceae bacterium]
MIKAEKIIRENERKKTKTLFYLDDDYPARLKNYNDSPVILYAEGTGVFNNPRTLGIVGTRNATKRGKLIVDRIISDLRNLISR